MCSDCLAAWPAKLSQANCPKDATGAFDSALLSYCEGLGPAGPFSNEDQGSASMDCKSFLPTRCVRAPMRVGFRQLPAYRGRSTALAVPRVQAASSDTSPIRRRPRNSLRAVPSAAASVEYSSRPDRRGRSDSETALNAQSPDHNRARRPNRRANGGGPVGESWREPAHSNRRCEWRPIQSAHNGAIVGHGNCGGAAPTQDDSMDFEAACS